MYRQMVLSTCTGADITIMGVVLFKWPLSRSSGNKIWIRLIGLQVTMTALPSPWMTELTWMSHSIWPGDVHISVREDTRPCAATLFRKCWGQLGILHYHLDVEPWRWGRKQNPPCPTRSQTRSDPKMTTSWRIATLTLSWCGWIP